MFQKLDGLVRGLNPGPLAPKARIMPLDQRAADGQFTENYVNHVSHNYVTGNMEIMGIIMVINNNST